MFYDVEETVIKLFFVRVTFLVVLTRATSTAEVRLYHLLSEQVIIALKTSRSKGL